MTPTNKLRFVEREVQVPAPALGTNITKTIKVRILQQWWEPVYPFAEWPWGWRDVPLEEEE